LYHNLFSISIIQIESEIPSLVPTNITAKINSNFKIGLLNFWDSYIIILLLPLIDQCVCPLLRTRPPSMLQRVGTGFVLLIITVAILAVATATLTEITFQLVVIMICLITVSLGQVLMLVAGQQEIMSRSCAIIDTTPHILLETLYNLHIDSLLWYAKSLWSLQVEHFTVLVRTFVGCS